MARAAASDTGIGRAVRALGDPRAVPDVAWVVQLTGLPKPRVLAALKEAGRHVGVQQRIRERHVEGGRDFYAQFRAPLELYALVRLLHPDHVVETGVSSGVSSAHFLLGLRANGRGALHSIDLPTRQKEATLAERESPVSLPPGRTPGWAVPEDLHVGWDLHLGPSQDLLPGVVRDLPKVDLFLHDSHHTPSHLTFELMAVLPKLVPGSVVLADNTQWTGRAFDRFAHLVGAPVFRRRGSDLVGLRIPTARPRSRARATKPRRASRRRPARRR